MRLNIKVIAPIVLVALMLIGAVSMASPPSPLGSEEWPLPSEDLSLANITSSMKVNDFTFLGGQPITSLGEGLSFPIGSEAIYYAGVYKNSTFVAFVLAKLPSAQSSVQFGGRALTILKENLPESEVNYLVTNEGGYLQYQGGNQTLELWYGRSWYFEVLARNGGEMGKEAVQAIKEAIYKSIRNQKD